ncbi:Dynamin family protein [Paenibacillus uliginis N3/975]|uniref:Dynamin family protein n=2 Tax=Paenibacillus TaxID=44249 RepID=A0A1X7HI84_9BACL|nr:Dynamin family protein [Paenibacillus uliginis N3/975]
MTLKVMTEHETGYSTSGLEAVRDRFVEWNDESSAALIEDLIRKQATGELTLAFCGHFSAGKSSMINALCGKKVLPSGPVPTSANVVTIRNGASKAVIHRPDGGLGETLNVSTEELAAYCKEGGEYSAIEVWDDISILGGHGVLMDTPGVDSTDDGHRQATHSALHMADVVFYVMDYNHVQSESNLLFAKSLSDWGKPLYLIVNQIDKHRDEELSLSSYLDDVKKAFAQWKVRYSGLMCVSLKVWDHPYNQWNELKTVIGKLLGSREALLDYSVACSARHAADNHAEAYVRSHQEEKEQLLDEMGGEAVAAALHARVRELEQEQNTLSQLPDEVRAELRREGDHLLANANLTPADIRDLALSFLESRQRGFKKGFLFASAKTEEERAKRLEMFHQRLAEQITAQVDWHARNLFRSFVERFEPWNKEWEGVVDDLLPTFSKDRITSTVNPEAVISGEYVLNYCKLLSEEIKDSYRRAVSELADRLRALAADDTAVRLEALERQHAELLAQSSASARYAALQRAEADRALAAAQLVPQLTSLTPGLLPEVREPAALPKAAASAGSPAAQQGNGGPAPQRSAPQGAAGGRRQRLEAAAAELRAAAALLAPYPALASPARDLTARADALAGGSFTLALFGAFSAGKSSFANALLGESVLPVSPHPTTAAVNRIVVPTAEHPHGTAAVRMKTRESWWDDLKYSFSVLGLPEPDQDSWRKTAEGLTPEGVHPAGLPHYGFLKAAAAGWDGMNGKLGTTESVGMKEYRGFVADETKSCYVDGIDLYYSCPLTEQGIVLVDTPGADSLHARHTGVTFSYIKNADAIVYVTYYNHAFSKADRQFLSQLGRVKDSFSLDKMFFVVNAADLASSPEELDEVVAHVRSNLVTSGVSSPHIFPVSSLLALRGKLSENEEELHASGFMPFEKSLDRFALEDLPGLSLRAGYDEISSARRRAEAWAELAEQDEVTRSRRIKGLELVGVKALEYFNALKSIDMSREIAQECGELLFHVRQRLDYAMGRFFQEAFHPSVLREDAGNLKSAFAACGRDLQRTLSVELDQEIWATTLRLEQKGRVLAEEAARHTLHDISSLTEGLELSLRQDREWATPELEETELIVEGGWLSYWSHFKNPKHFFEGHGSQKLREAAEPKVKDAAATVVKQREILLVAHYAEEIKQSLEMHSNVLQEQLEESVKAMVVSLQDGQSPDMWRKLSERLLELEQRLPKVGK